MRNTSSPSHRLFSAIRALTVLLLVTFLIACGGSSANKNDAQVNDDTTSPDTSGLDITLQDSTEPSDVELPDLSSVDVTGTEPEVSAGCHYGTESDAQELYDTETPPPCDCALVGTTWTATMGSEGTQGTFLAKDDGVIELRRWGQDLMARFSYTYDEQTGLLTMIDTSGKACPDDQGASYYVALEFGDMWNPWACKMRLQTISDSCSQRSFWFMFNNFHE